MNFWNFLREQRILFVDSKKCKNKIGSFVTKPWPYEQNDCTILADVQELCLKGLSHQIRFAWKWCGSLGQDKDMWRWTFNIFLLSL
jgi:hypothetical protein